MIKGLLGDVYFVVSGYKILTPNDVSRSRQARIAKHDILGKKPKLEFQGVDLAEISFNIRFDESLGVDIKREFRKLNNMFENGLVADFAIGSEYYGEYLISRLDDNIRRTYGSGDTLVLETSITLQEYGYGNFNKPSLFSQLSSIFN